MSILAGYILFDEIFRSSGTTVSRARATADNQDVVIKFLNREFPSHDDAVKIKREFEIVRRLDLEGTVRPLALLPYQKSYALVLEDFGGASLSSLMESRRLTLLECLSIGVTLADTLGKIHQRGVIHKDIKPQNIIVNETTGQVKLTDFRISSVIGSEHQELVNPDRLEGTFPYIAPEQTGRMNRSIDTRTDLYSLGVTLYEMLTGRLPFMAKDPLEFIHCHIAVSPVPPQRIDPQIPDVLNAMVLRLLAKNAEERYQSGFGLRYDLENCLSRLRDTGRMESFPLATHDIPSTLQIPEKLYGREAELAELLSSFDRAAAGNSCLLLVTGPPGIGKSTLVRELYRPVVASRAHFAAGKFGKYQGDIPYSALVTAFDRLIKQILCEPPSRLDAWREELAVALGPNAGIVIDLVPELELVLGRQPPVTPLPPAESQNRFNLVVSRFVKVLAGTEHPLVLFLDDLQWADAGTLNLLGLLASDREIRGLLLIGAFRDNEVGPTHPLTLVLDRLSPERIPMQRLQITALSMEGVALLLTETFFCHPSEAEFLARLVMAKTNGNPFFIHQFIKTLCQEGLIRFVAEENSWQWDQDGVSRAGITINVVELLCQKIRRLPAAIQQVLTAAACFGNSFSVNLLAKLCGLPQREVLAALMTPLKEGLLRPHDMSYKYLDLGEGAEPVSDPASSTVEGRFFFVHDQVHQAAYSLLDDAERDRMHLALGRIMLHTIAESQVAGDVLFQTLDHLIPRFHLLTDPAELLLLAQYSLQAANKALASMATANARQCAHNGVRVLGDNGWNDHYELCRDLHLSWAESAYLSGHFDEAEAALAIFLEHARSAEEKAQGYGLKVVIYCHLNRMAEATAAGIEGLRFLGVTVPDRPGKVRVGLEFLSAVLLLRGRGPEALLLLPEVTQARWQQAMALLAATMTAAYFSNKDLFSLLCLRAFILTLRHGICDYTAFTFFGVGFPLADNFSAYQLAFNFGKAAVSLSESRAHPQMRSKSLSLFGMFMFHWCEPLEQGEGLLRQAFSANFETGDLTYAGYVSSTLELYFFSQGKHIEEHLTESAAFLAAARRAGDQFATEHHRLCGQVLQNLKGLTRDPLSLDGEDFDEEQALQEYLIRQNGNILFHFYLYKAMILFLNGRYVEAARLCDEAGRYLYAVSLLPSVADHAFYHALALAASCPDPRAGIPSGYGRQVRRSMRQFAKWAKVCPANFLPRYYLIRAEWERLQGCPLEAMESYEKSIAAAAEHGFIHVEAMASERAALLHLTRGSHLLARGYLTNAHYCFSRWGATVKLRQLDEAFLTLTGHRERGSATDSFEALRSTGLHAFSTSIGSSGVLDLMTVIKASHELSGEMALNRLLVKLMQIVIENAGAQRGVLLVEEQGRLRVQATGTADGSEPEISDRQFLEERDDLPVAMIHYVAQTGDTVVLDDAVTAATFATDPYIVAQQVRSLLCMPIRRQGKLAAMLYLENNLTEGVFHVNRVEILKILSAQIAISIENATLYEGLEQKVIERTRELQRALDEITLLSNTDPLTGLSNRRHFFAQFEQELIRASRYRRPLSLLMLDIDHFKKINDTYGHQQGDVVLVDLAAIMKVVFRKKCDIIGRVGGEEFAVLLTETPYPNIQVAAERLRAAVANHPFVLGTTGESLSVTISLGGLSLDEPPYPSKDIIYSLADQALYEAKNGGRNRSVCNPLQDPALSLKTSTVAEGVSEGAPRALEGCAEKLGGE